VITIPKKLLLAGLVVASVTAYMAYLGASASWQYYLSVDECLDRRPTLAGSRIRVSGTVTPATLQVDTDRTRASFQLQGAQGRLGVTCQCSLPDNLAENMPVVVEGRLDDAGRLQGNKLLTRCASKYEAQLPGHAPRTAARPVENGR
jgi:cytochrome c-type biogenesis protein CcmE